MPTIIKQRIQHLIRGLDDDEFKIREESERELMRIGQPTVIVVEKTTNSRSAEVRARAKRILARDQVRADFSVYVEPVHARMAATLKELLASAPLNAHHADNFLLLQRFMEQPNSLDNSDCKFVAKRVLISVIKGILFNQSSPDAPTGRQTVKQTNASHCECPCRILNYFGLIQMMAGTRFMRRLVRSPARAEKTPRSNVSGLSRRLRVIE